MEAVELCKVPRFSKFLKSSIKILDTNKIVMTCVQKIKTVKIPWQQMFSFHWYYSFTVLSSVGPFMGIIMVSNRENLRQGVGKSTELQYETLVPTSQQLILTCIIMSLNLLYFLPLGC